MSVRSFIALSATWQQGCPSMRSLMNFRNGQTESGDDMLIACAKKSNDHSTSGSKGGASLSHHLSRMKRLRGRLQIKKEFLAPPAQMRAEHFGHLTLTAATMYFTTSCSSAARPLSGVVI